MTSITINRLPVNTWNRLNVNAAQVTWQENAAGKTENTIHAKNSETVTEYVSISGGSAYAEQTLFLNAGADSRLTVFETVKTACPQAAQVNIKAQENAQVRLVQLLYPTCGALLRHEISADLAQNAKVEILTLMLGDGDIYADNRVTLTGKGSSLDTKVAYLGQKEQKLDYNIEVLHFGQNTSCDIAVNGALTDASQKVFRGTIDFKNGSSGSVGHENEAVLMLGNDVVNKTVPLILCAEENVEGTHGATIGELDEATLFYFESRGMDKKTAESMLARAALVKLVSLADDERFAKDALDAVNTLLPEAPQEV